MTERYTEWLAMLAQQNADILRLSLLAACVGPTFAIAVDAPPSQWRMWMFRTYAVIVLSTFLVIFIVAVFGGKQ
jgi:hypothetical protein